MIERVAVMGAGMGNGIAHTLALQAIQVTLIDVSADALSRARGTIASNLDRQAKKGAIDAGAKDAALGRIRDTTAMADAAGVDLVIEAASEDPRLKSALFAELDRLGPTAILATNTSSISITEIAAIPSGRRR